MNEAMDPSLKVVRLSRADMLRHAQDWIAAWNRRDIDAVLADFAADACFRSPLARQLTGNATLAGQAAIGAYWRQALGRIGTLRFRLLRAICDEADQSMVVHFESTFDGTTRHACEIFVFREGKKSEAEALYGEMGAALVADMPAGR